MNKFNDVFLAVKKHCDSERRLAVSSQLEAIAKDAGVRTDALGEYLAQLERLGLVKYSIEEKYVYLTSFGRKQEHLTKNN